MKKFFVALLSFLLTFTLTACGNEIDSSTTDNSEGETAQDISTVTPATYTLSDEERTRVEQVFGTYFGNYDYEQAIAFAMVIMSLQKVSIGGPEYQDTPIGTYIVDDSRLEMTKANIAYTWEKIDNAEVSEENQAMYQEILNRWFEEDFENITSEVQALIEFLNGTNETIIIPQPENESELFVRKTEEEEKAYVQKFFRN